MKYASISLMSFTPALVVACIVFAVTTAHADGAKHENEPAWQPVEKTTYDERTKAHPANHPAPFDALMIPYSRVAQLKPMIARKGQRPNFGGPMEQYIDRFVPLDEKHEAYLDKRQELADAPLKLIAWCKQNKLGECAEYEARRMLDQMRDASKPEYKLCLDAWLEERDKQQIPYSFPLPVEGEWFVVEDKTQHHRLDYAGAYAFDLIKKVDGRQCKDWGRKNEEHYAWGQPIIAQADGVVVTVINDFEDNRPRVESAVNTANCVIVDYGGGIRAIYGHCMKGSAKVKVGDKVKCGDTLALVGNSGASGAPHLHFSMLDSGNISIRGRYTFQTNVGRIWKKHEGENLPEGKAVRNVVENEKPTKLFP